MGFRKKHKPTMVDLSPEEFKELLERLETDLEQMLTVLQHLESANRKSHGILAELNKAVTRAGASGRTTSGRNW